MADIITTLGIDDRGFRRGLRGAEEATRSSSARMGGALRFAGRVAGVAGVAGLAVKAIRGVSEASRRYAEDFDFASRSTSNFEANIDRLDRTTARYKALISTGIKADGGLFDSLVKGSQRAADAAALYVFGAEAIQNMKDAERIDRETAALAKYGEARKQIQNELDVATGATSQAVVDENRRREENLRLINEASKGLADQTKVAELRRLEDERHQAVLDKIAEQELKRGPTGGGSSRTIAPGLGGSNFALRAAFGVTAAVDPAADFRRQLEEQKKTNRTLEGLRRDMRGNRATYG